jgi:predicted AAA+ superfamily ATPase
MSNFRFLQKSGWRYMPMTNDPKKERLDGQSSPFVGRDSAIQQFRDALGSRAWIISISGSGGIGKTRLLQEVRGWVAQENKFDRILHFCGEDFDSYEDLLLGVLRALGTSGPELADITRLEEQAYIKLGSQKVLLILDAFEKVDYDPRVKDFFRQLPSPSKALITTRHRLGIGEYEITLSGLGFKDASRLIEAEAARLGISQLGFLDEANQRQLWEVSGGSPLAIKWMIGQIAQQSMRVDRFLKTYSSELSDAEVLDYIFSHSWKQLDSSSQQLLMLLALSERGLSYSDIRSMTGFSRVETDEALQKLISLSLINQAVDSTQSLLSVHPLTKRYIEMLLGRETPQDHMVKFLAAPARKHVFRDIITLAAAVEMKKDEFARRSRGLLDSLMHLLDTDRQETEVVYRRLHGFIVDTTSMFSKVDALKKLPVIFVRRRELRRIDLDGAKHLVGTLLGSSRRISILIILTQEEKLDKAQWLVEEERKALYGFDFILLTEEEIKRIALASEPTELLRKIVLAQVNLLAVSPFVATGRTPDSVFFGREEIFREIVEHIDSASYAVIGGRRIGKTSTLSKLHSLHLPAVGFRTLYHDCATTHTYKDFLNASIRDWQPEPPKNTPATFGDLLQLSSEDKPIVLLLDEADKLIPADRVSDWPLFRTLRALGNSGQAQVVLSGERTLRDALRDPKSPLFNFANEILLGPLDYRAVEELVTRPMKQLEIELEDEKVLVDQIWNFTSGHPNVVQRLCRRLIEHLNEQDTRRITINDVDTVIEDPGFQRDDFLSTYLERATPLEKIISLLMADNSEIRTLQTLRGTLEDRCDLHPSARETDDALQRLVDLRSILKRTPSGYEFAVKAFPRVVAGTMTLNDMLMILTEEYEEQGE